MSAGDCHLWTVTVTYMSYNYGCWLAWAAQQMLLFVFTVQTRCLDGVDGQQKGHLTVKSSVTAVSKSLFWRLAWPGVIPGKWASKQTSPKNAGNHSSFLFTRWQQQFAWTVGFEPQICPSLEGQGSGPLSETVYHWTPQLYLPNSI